MDTGTLIAILGGIGALIGGIYAAWSGRMQGTASVNQLLQSRVEQLAEDVKTRNEIIANLREQVKMLTDLVTQKANVQAVQEKAEEIKNLLDKIAEKLGVSE